MKNMLAVTIAVIILFSFTAVPVLAGKNGPAGSSNVGHLYLYQKDPSTWEIAKDGAWGKMHYSLSGPVFDFVFNGHGLEDGWNYSLIYYPDPWPGEGLICLGSGMANLDGDVHISGAVETGDLPQSYDENVGAKIWLVLSDDVDCINQRMTGWNPNEYLFEYQLINFMFVENMQHGNGMGWGMPALHGVDGKTFGQMVSDLAKSEPGAVADHVRNTEGGANGKPAQHGMSGKEFGKAVSDKAKGEPGAVGNHASGH